MLAVGASAEVGPRSWASTRLTPARWAALWAQRAVRREGVWEAMDLRFFFQGMLDREESASALLATLLDGEPRFRAAFLQHVLGDRDDAHEGPWSVSVETDNVDVVMASSAL